MLSVAPVSSSSGAADYFAKDNYYSGEQNSEASAWGGVGAEQLDLKGEVTKEAFEAILNGVQPDGTKVGDVKNRQLGVDLTFSMPKSASVMAYVAGDARVLDAHMRAVKATMGWVERTFAEGRSYERTKNGEPVRTGNLVYALFQHDTSRALDPQGHIHVIVANMTRMANGVWQALHNGQLWKNNSTIGAAYHAQFRAELQKLGYQTEVTGKHGQFEIKGVPDAVLKEFSQRREAIMAKAEELGIKSPAGRDSVTTNSRDPKLNVEDRDSMRASWRERAAALGFDGKQLMAKASARSGQSGMDQRPGTIDRIRATIADVGERLGGMFSASDPLVDRGLERLRLAPVDVRTQAAVASAVRILEQREAAFSLPQVSHAALSLGLAGVTAEKVDARVSELLKTERLVPGVSNRIDNAVTHVTTPGALATETKILGEIDRGKGTVVPIIPAEGAVERLQAAAGDKQLNAGQLAAATLALTSEDRIVAVQGVAGAGKSTVLSAIARVAEAEGKDLLGLAFQNKVAGALREETGIESTTVSSFVNTYARHALAGKGDGYDAARASLKGKVLVLDEASMVANEPMRHVVGIANALGVEKLLLVGDRQQIQPIDAGKAFSLIQSSDVALARMDENLRQRTDQLRTVAALTNVGEARKALGVLGENVREERAEGGEKRHVLAAAEHWLGLSAEERERTAIFTSGREARATINQAVQTGLRHEGTLSGDGKDLTVLARVNVAREELRYPQSYEKGQVLEVTRAMPDIGLKRGRYDVLGVDTKGRVEVQVGTKTKKFDPQKIDPKDKRDALGLSRPEQLRLHEGDRIKWTMNDKDRGLLNSDLARVLSVGKDGITVETVGKNVVELKSGDPMLERLGLAYALNMHMAQGMTADNGIGVMGSGERNLSNQRLFNVMVTRTRDELTLYTDDKDKLARQLESNPGNKSSALETIGRVEIDRERAPSGAGGKSKPDFNPTLTPDLERASAPSNRTMKTGLGPEPQLNVPEKGLELGL